MHCEPNQVLNESNYIFQNISTEFVGDPGRQVILSDGFIINGLGSKADPFTYIVLDSSNSTSSDYQQNTFM